MLKDLLTEEEAKGIVDIIYCYKLQNKCACHKSVDSEQYTNSWNCMYEAIKQSGIIRKSPLEEAREKTDELVKRILEEKLAWCSFDLNQLIQLERQEADKIISSKG
jgi:polyhydroxyalkanoate synthesis regulator phasin